MGSGVRLKPHPATRATTVRPPLGAEPVGYIIRGHNGVPVKTGSACHSAAKVYKNRGAAVTALKTSRLRKYFKGMGVTIHPVYVGAAVDFE